MKDEWKDNHTLITDTNFQKRYKESQFKDFDKREMNEILAQAYSEDIARSRLFWHADEQAKLIYQLAELDQVENWLLVGKQDKKLTNTSAFGFSKKENKNAIDFLNNFINQQFWDVVDEGKLKEKLEEIWVEEEVGKDKWEANWREWIAQELKFSKKEINDLEKCFSSGGKPTPFESSRVQQIYLANLRILKEKWKFDNPHGVDIKEGRTVGFGDIGHGRGVPDSNAHADWLVRLKERIEEIETKLEIKVWQERVQGLKNSMSILGKRAWKAESSNQEFSQMYADYTRENNGKAETKNIDSWSFGSWLGGINDFLAEKDKWVQEEMTKGKSGPNFFALMSGFKQREKGGGAEKEKFKEEFEHYVSAKKVKVVETLSERKKKEEITWNDALDYQKIVAWDENDQTWRTVNISGKEASRAYLLGWLPSDLGFKIIGWEGDKPKLVPVVIIKEEKFVGETAVAPDGLKTGETGEIGKIPSSRVINWEEAVNAGIGLIVRKVEWRKISQDYQEELEKEKKVLEEERERLEAEKLTAEATDQEQTKEKIAELEKIIINLVMGETKVFRKPGNKDNTKEVEYEGEIQKLAKESNEKLIEKINELEAENPRFGELRMEIENKLKEANDLREKAIAEGKKVKWSRLNDDKKSIFIEAEDPDLQEKLTKLAKEIGKDQAELNDLTNENEELKKLRQEIKKFQNLAEKIGKGNEINLVEGEEKWIEERNNEIEEIKKKINQFKEAKEKIATEKKKLIEENAKKLEQNRKKMEECEEKETKIATGDNSKFKVRTKSAEKNFVAGGKNAELAQKIRKLKNGLENDTELKEWKAELSEKSDEAHRQYLGDDKKVDEELSNEIIELHRKIREREGEKPKKIAELERQLEKLVPLDNYFPRTDKKPVLAESNDPKNNDKEKNDPVKLFAERKQKFVNPRDKKSTEKKEFAEKMEKLQDWHDTFWASRSLEYRENKRKLISCEDAEGNDRDPREIKTLQGWLDVGIQLRHKYKEEDGTLGGERVPFLNEVEIIDVEAINKEREAMGITENLKGGKLDLRGYKNLHTLIIPAGELETPITSIDISDCPRLGEAADWIRKLNNTIELIKEENEEGGLAPEKLTENNKKIEKLESWVKYYEKRGIKVDFGDEFKGNTDYKWVKAREDLKAKEKEKWEAKPEEEQKKDNIWNNREFGEKSVIEKFEKEAVVESELKTLKDWLNWKYSGDEGQKEEEEIIDIDEINKERDGRGLKEPLRFLVGKKIGEVEEMAGGERKIETKNILFPTGFKNLKKIRYLGEEYDVPKDLNLDERVNSWRGNVRFGTEQYVSSFTLASWIENLEKGRRGQFFKPDAKPPENEEAATKWKEVWDKLSEEQKKIAADWDEVYQKILQFYPKITEEVVDRHLDENLWPTFIQSLIIDIVNKGYVKNEAEKRIIEANKEKNIDETTGNYIHVDGSRDTRYSKTEVTKNELLGRFNLDKAGRDKEAKKVGTHPNSINDLIELVGKVNSELEIKIKSLVELRKVMLEAEAVANKVGVTEEAALEEMIDPRPWQEGGRNEVPMADWVNDCLTVLGKLKKFAEAAGSLDIIKESEDSEFEEWDWDKAGGDSPEKWAFKVYEEERKDGVSVAWIYDDLVRTLYDHWMERIVEAEEAELNIINGQIEAVDLSDKEEIEIIVNEGGDTKTVPGWKAVINKLIELLKLIIDAKKSLETPAKKTKLGVVAAETDKALAERHKGILEGKLKELEPYQEAGTETVEGIVKSLTNGEWVKEKSRFSWIWNELKNKIIALNEEIEGVEEFFNNALAELAEDVSLEEQKTRLKALKTIRDEWSKDDAPINKKNLWDNRGGEINDFYNDLEPVIEGREELVKRLGEIPVTLEDREELLKHCEDLEKKYWREAGEGSSEQKAWEFERLKALGKITGLKRTIEDGFIDDFKKARGEAEKLANDIAKREKVLKFRKIAEFENVTETVDKDKKRNADGEKVGEFYNQEWTDPEEFVMVEVSVGNWELKTWLENNLWDKKVKRSEVGQEIWLREFVEANPGVYVSLGIITDDNKLKYLGYRGKGIPAKEARQIKENSWESGEVVWKDGEATANCSLDGWSDSDINVLEVKKDYLFKIYVLLSDIKKAGTIEELEAIDINHAFSLIGSPEKLPTGRKKADVERHWNDKKISLETVSESDKAINRIKTYWNNLKMTGEIKDICGGDWESKLKSKTGSELSQQESQFKDLIRKAKIQPDITEIENELNQSPAISSSELGMDYLTEMLNLANKDTERTNKKTEIINKIKDLRAAKIAEEKQREKERKEKEAKEKAELEAKKTAAQQLITSAKEILAKDKATKAEVEKSISDLKTLAATQNSPEKEVWEENKDANQKLLKDLEGKLVKIDNPDPEKETPPEIPTPPPSPTPEEEKKEIVKKFGTDFTNLKTEQQEGRKKIVENWKKETGYSRSKTCQYCPREFSYDKSLEYLVAHEKVNKELKDHENSCSNKSKPEEIKKVKQENWEKVKKTKTRHFYACRKCWGKVELDKGITDWEEAKKQGRADLAYHEEHECGSKGTKKIGIYFSPNQGGNEHAPLTYADKIKESEVALEKDNQGEVYLETEQPVVNQQKEPYNWIPWLIGGSLLFLGAELLLIWFIKRKNKKIKKSKK